MKRFIAVFGVIIIITMHCLSFYPAKAAITGIDYGEMLNTYLGAAETALAASQGVSIDWSDIDLPEGSDTWTDKQKAQYIVQYVGNLKKVGQHAIYQWLFGEGNDTQDIISAETAAIGLSNNSNLYTQDIKAQLDNILATQSQEHIFQRYSDKVIALWNEYDTNYINNYLQHMNYRDNDNSLPPSLQPFESYIAIGNSWNYFVNPVTGGTGNKYGSKFIQYMYLRQNVSLFFQPESYYAQRNVDNLNIIDALENIGSEINFIIAYNLNDVDFYAFINSDTHSLTMPNVTVMNWIHDEYNSNGLAGCYRKINGVFPIISQSSSNYSKSLSFNFNSNEDAFLFYSKYFVNTPLLFGTSIDNAIRIDSSGYNISGGLTVTLPNAVIDNSADDGKIVAHPIYYPDTMNTDKAIDIDLDKVIDAIASRISQGADDITFDDLVDAGAAVKLDGTTLTDADTVVKDVSIPIARARVNTIDGVVPTIDVVPPLPPLPPLTPGDYSGEGFNGMSVLARIINATVQGLPKPLILTFFGVVFGAVILGIIKILHH